MVVDFWAEWCGPCRMIAPALEEISKSLNGKVKIVKLNVDENPGTAAKYGIMSIPTLMLFKDGQLASRQVGAAPKQKLEQWITARCDPRLTSSSSFCRCAPDAVPRHLRLRRELLVLLAFAQFVGDLLFEIGHQRLAELLTRRHAVARDDRLPRNQLLTGRRSVERREIVESHRR